MVVELVQFVFDDERRGILFGLDAAGNPYVLKQAADGTIRPIDVTKVKELDAFQIESPAKLLQRQPL